MSVKRAGEWFTELPKHLTAKQNEIAVRVLKEIRERLKFLVDVGLEYLTLARACGTLSGGESQRIRLASQIGSGLDRRALRARRAFDRAAPARQCAAAGDAEAAARPRQHRDRGRARRGRHPHRRPRARHRPRRRHPRRPHRRPGHGRRPDRGAAIAHRQISVGRAGGADSRAAAEERAPHAQARQRPRQQPQERHRRDPARPVHLRHRRLRRRQVDAAGRHALQGDRAQAQRRQRGPCPARPHRGARAPRQGDRHRPVADRPHAALATRRPIPARSRRSANGSPACRRRRRAATSPAASRSTSRAGAARPARATA